MTEATEAAPPPIEKTESKKTAFVNASKEVLAKTCKKALDFGKAYGIPITLAFFALNHGFLAGVAFKGAAGGITENPLTKIDLADFGTIQAGVSAITATLSGLSLPRAIRAHRQKVGFTESAKK